ncbi:MAG: PD-(D/E)XK motif protein [Planctomycetia bacterium]|nr:PD-(D/E)XK motif protein [Planctomycetia bacterium]
MRLCHEGQGLRVFAAVTDAARTASIVVEIPEQLTPRRLTMVSGRRLSVIAGGVAGLPAGRVAIVLRLRDAEFEDLFAQLGTDLLAGIQRSTSAGAAVQSITRLIERWRRFLDQRHSMLAAEEVRGLIGELCVLDRSVDRLGPAAALAAWKSPQGSIRDFEFTDRTIEVKTILAAVGGSVRINEPMQLQPEPSVPLFLVCQELGRSDTPQSALPGHIARVASRFAHEMKLAEDFEDALAASGYLPAHAETYTDGFTLGPLHAFLVGPGFPRIHPDAVPPGVLRVQFSLEVLQLSRFGTDPDLAVGPVPSPSTQLP